MKRILYIQYTNPAGYPPLAHSSRLLADAGWQVLFLGTNAFGSHGLRFLPHPNIAVRQMAFCPPGWRQKLHYVRFVLWCVSWAVRWRPTWAYVSDPLGCPAGLALNRLPGLRVIYHEHDSPDPRNAGRLLRWCLAARRGLAHRAELCVLPNAERAERFRAETGADRVVCVWNCPRAEEVGPARPSAPASDVWLLYHGSITPPQLPVGLLDALARLPERVRLRVVGYETAGHAGYVQRLKAAAARLGLARRVEFVGAVPTRTELLDLCGRSDIGLALFAPAGHQPMPGASNKPFDYLARGLPVLVSDQPEWRQMYAEPGYARACNPEDADSIAGAIRWFLDHPDRMRGMGEAGRQRVRDEWNYESQFRPVQRLIGGAAPRDRP